MTPSLLIRFVFPSQPLGLRLLVLLLSIGWLGAAAGSIFFLGYMVSLPNAPATPPAMWLMIGGVLGEHQKVWGSRGQQLLRLPCEAVLVGEDNDPTTRYFPS